MIAADAIADIPLSNKWTKIQYNGFSKFAALTPITGNDILVPLKELKTNNAFLRGEKVCILSGTHGTASISNWVNGVRDPNLLEHDFLVEDGTRYGKSKKITVLNTKNMSQNDFRKVLKDDCHVIVACCFSRNDAVYKSTFGLRNF